ncbi:NAD(P)/FAD-dependent oxidoreductase [Nocardia huaxiensis]|uniref:NAD(P)/FAD-dependent oxidoreductase n=1 Tax=Nocardia huaxiensis TaxID=2755382 RepID=UPI001E5358F9|nr:FAD-dependent oxidoreductase [Nocardia huaxiensis]UFS98764.1 FAD-dependent oxidoreductase [Nocardia huaxiensis]
MGPAKIVIVGGGFAGVECARYLERHLRPEEAFVQLVAPSASLLYLPLLPQVASGVLSPRAVAVSMRRVLRRTEYVPGMVVGVDPKARQCVVRRASGVELGLDYDHLVLTPGSITRIMDVPGLREHGFGMKTLAEALYLRDHVLRQLDVAAVRGDEEEDRERLNFITIGAGYAGTETAAVLNRLTRAAAKRYFPRLDPSMVRWRLVTHGDRLMPELGERLGADAKEILAKRGVEFVPGLSAAEVTARSVTLTNGEVIPTRTVVWTAGVAPSPLAGHLGADTVKGRIVAAADLTVPGLPGVWACGDAAAVPDLTKGGDVKCAPTAQHAMRQGKHLGANLVATLRGKTCKQYKHRDLGMVVDLGRWDALARPLGLGLSGAPAQLVTRGYHLMALRTFAARARTVFDWSMHGVTGDDFMRIGYSDFLTETIGGFERTSDYLTADEVAKSLVNDPGLA